MGARAAARPGREGEHLVLEKRESSGMESGGGVWGWHQCQFVNAELMAL